MNGCILPGTNISVDFWKIRNQHCSNLTFFLTHLHGDHTTGLTSSWQQLIYCTEITAHLIEKRYGIEHRYLRPLEVNSSHLIITDEIKNTTISVTVIEANHCPGAAMFLFEGDFGKILHTGDFRYDPSMFDASSPLSSHIGNIDTVYLDNTFCSPDCVFPSREVVQEEILQVIQSFPKHNIVIGTRKLGKEALLVWLAENLQEWISVSGDQFAVAEVLDLPRVLKVQDSECRIRTIPFNWVCKKNMRKWNAERPTLAILPSAIYKGIGGEPFVNQDDVYVVPYSDHSSFTELNEFVSKLKPSKVVPIVSANTKGPFGVSLKSRADMSVFDKFCLGTDKRCRSLVSSQPSQIHHQNPGSNSSVSKQRLVKARSKRRPNRKVRVVKGVQFGSEDLESVVDLGKIESKEKGNVCTQYEIKKMVNNCTENTGSESPALVRDPVVVVIDDEEEDEIPREVIGGGVAEHPTESQVFDIPLISKPSTEAIDPRKPDVIDPVVIVIEDEEEGAIPCEDNGGIVTEHPTESEMFDISLILNPCTEPIDTHHKPDDKDGRVLSLQSKLACHKEPMDSRKSDVIDPVVIVIEDEEEGAIPCEDNGGIVTEHPTESEMFDSSLILNPCIEPIDTHHKPDDKDGRALSLQSKLACHKEPMDSRKPDVIDPVVIVIEDEEEGAIPCEDNGGIVTEHPTESEMFDISLILNPCTDGRALSLQSKSACHKETDTHKTMSLRIIPLTNARNCTGRKNTFENPQCQDGIGGGCQSQTCQEIHNPKTKAVKETDDSIPRSNEDSFDTDSFCSIYTASSNSVEFSAGSCDATLDDTDMLHCDPVAELVDTHTSTSNHSCNSRKNTVPFNEPSQSFQEPSEISSLDSVSSKSETKINIPSNETSPSVQERPEISSLDSKNETSSGPSQATLEALFQSKRRSSSSSSTSSESTSAMNKNHKQLQHICTTNDNNLMDTFQPDPLERPSPSENTHSVIVSAENQHIDKLSVPGRKRNGSEMESLDDDRTESVSVSKKSKMFPFGLSVKSVSECNEKTSRKSWMKSILNWLNIHK